MEKNKKRTARYSKINRISVVDQVCASIKQDIADNVWKAGDKIPSETELAEMFGVNRLSVRMALQKLSTLGIIETRIGEGSFVRSFSLRPFLSEIAIFYGDDQKFHDVQQLRNLLEGECMNIAIMTSSTEEKKALKQALDCYYDVSRIYYSNIENADYLEQLVDADFNFHYQVIRMGHNELYRDVYYMVQQLIRRHITQLLRTRFKRLVEGGVPFEPSKDIHLEIYDSIMRGDADTARRARELHLGIVPIEGVDA